MAGDVSSSGSSAGHPDQDRPAIPDAPLALYRRYRPATFAEVKGQEHVTEPLRQALRSGRVHHAYLFSGPRGCGKTSSARILARSLNCELGPTPDPCGKCASCVALAPAGPGSIDVIEIDAASHGGIDDARDLRERAFYSPVSGRYKIYIIDEAHMVTGAGFNALLKLVEEPPPHLKFVFATTEPEKVIPTIRSRTHHYPFRLVPPAILRELLEEILQHEGISYEPAVLPVVIRAGAGSVRDSLSILDQLIAGSGEAGLRYDRAIALLGYTDDALLDEMAEAFAARDGAAVFLAIDHVVEAGHDPRRFAMDLLDRLRDLIVLGAVPGAGASGLIDAPEDQLERMRKQAAEFGQDRLVRAAETISNGLVEMRGATSPRLLLELMCAQVLLPAEPGRAEPAVEDDAGELAARVERLERELAAGAGSARRELPRPGSRADAVGPATGTPADRSGSDRSAAGRPPADQRVPGGPGPAIDLDVLRSRWPDVLDTVREVSKVAWILLSKASVESLDGNVLTAAFDTEGNAKGFANSGSDGYLADVLQSMFGVRPVIRAVVNPAAGRAGGSARNAGQDPAAAPVRSSQGQASQGQASQGQASQGQASQGRASQEQPGRGKPSQAKGADGRSPAAAGGDRDDRPRAGRSKGGPANASPPAAAADRASEDHADYEGRSIRADQAAPAKRGQRATSRGTARAADGGRPVPRGRADPGLSDDPRPFTDAGTGTAASDLTGTDLVMRELGGRVIEELTDP
jgi:DNA polymerase III subunit gamma/tau